MKFMKTFAIFLFAHVALFFSACNTGLGDSVDLNGPTVTIISPEARENVGERFDIRGTVTDDFAVGLVTVELDGNTWQHKGSGWQYKAKGENNFVPDTESEWISENKKSVEWTIKGATISGAGTFTIEVKALDESGNSSEESSKSRDVVIDKNAPKITISAPPMSQEPNAFTAITDYKDITKVTQFLTGDFNVSGKTSEENAIKYVEVLIKEYGAEKELFKKRIVQNESDKTSESDTVVDALRSWEITVKLDECALGQLDEKQHILNIYTSTCDSAGNDSGLQFQGHACMWKEADKPWIDIILGDENAPKNIYSGSSILGNAYDDTAIKYVDVTIKKQDGAIVFQDKIYSADDNAEDENNVYFELPIPTDSGNYFLEITATDKNGKVSDTKKGWIKVVDKMFPSIDISQNTESGKLFCDKDGNFTLKITSKDESKVASLKMAYIINPSDIVEYSDSISEKWNATSTNLNDLKNGKAYVISPNDTGETVTENNLKRKIYKNEVKINIFNDLGIDGNKRKLTNQTFAFRVEDADQNALTSTYAIQGDIESPEIKFTKLEYYSYEGSTAITREQEGGDALPAFGEKTFVKVYGKISDNSTDVLGNYAKYLKLDLTANGNPITTSINNDGTFVAKASNLTGASLVFEGNVTDWGGNAKKQKYAFLVDSQTPRVEYISALTPEGFYPSGQTIQIFIRFNKKLDFQGTTKITLSNGKTTEKSTNTSGIGANDILFEYKIGKNDGNIESLNVTGAEFGTVKNEGADVTSEIKKSIEEIIKDESSGKNLAQMKKIGIITSVPKITSIEFKEDEKKLTITYDKPVAKGNEEVTIIQQKTENGKSGDGVDNVPAVLSESEGRTLFEKNSVLEQYYELTTNGADKNFNADLTSKYVLKYEYNSNKSEITKEYEATGAHKLSQNARAQGVSIDSTNKIVTVKFNSPLPCKGAKYKITVPAGFMQDEKGGSNFPADGDSSNEITASGAELPVIRIYKKETIVEAHKATQPLTTVFKIDCETPNVEPTCSYTYFKRNALALIGRSTNKDPLYFNYPGYDGNDILDENKTPQITNFKKFPYEGIKTSNGITKENDYNIGTGDWREGLEYHITASVGNIKTYAVAYRTVIEINGFPLDTNTYGLFIRGGDSPSGSNTVQGFPTSWDINKPEETRLFTKADIKNYKDEIVLRPDDQNRNIFYFTSWAITKDYYFMILRGKMDDKTNGTPGKGPSIGTMAQNSWVSYFAQYPINPGGYIRILNGTSTWGDNIFDYKNRNRNGSDGDSAGFEDGKEIIFTNR
ncbi:MAG: hypothetical protein K2N58_02025 [Treponemataceae bacterium]|nr:hypothetical protein [Treponemataceae bacterium]